MDGEFVHSFFMPHFFFNYSVLPETISMAFCDSRERVFFRTKFTLVMFLLVIILYIIRGIWYAIRILMIYLHTDDTHISDSKKYFRMICECFRHKNIICLFVADLQLSFYFRHLLSQCFEKKIQSKKNLLRKEGFS